jgi:CHAT domain-containing protein/cytochrome c-type biogenesis protein CcmH/NrfG
LTRPIDKHLDSDEFEGLISSPSTDAADSVPLSQEATGEARSHIANCQDCAKKVQMHDRAQNEILSLGTRTQPASDSGCISAGEWIKVAAGLLPEREIRNRLNHAAQCGHCGPLLREAVATLSSEVTSDEEELLASLESARPGWQRTMAATLQSNTSDKQVRAERIPWLRRINLPSRLGFAVLAMAVVLVTAWVSLRLIRPPSAEQLLANAYTEHRTLEIRIRGARFAPMQVERGGGRSNLDRPSSLLKAEEQISENLNKDPNFPAWLDAKSRADMLDGNYGSAIEALQRALVGNPDSANILTDLGSAYCAQANSTGRAVDYANAIEFLSKALKKTPDDPIALYNRAIANEGLAEYVSAAEDWQSYLRVDPQGDWADDVRKRLAAVRQKVESREKSLSEPLLTPEEIARVGTESEALRDNVDLRIEEYLRLAVTDWLPAAFPDSRTASSSSDDGALAFLAALTRERHHDTWLGDLLAHVSGPGFARAVKTLASSIQANQQGDYLAGRSFAHKSAELFRLAGSPAGVLRAKVEEIYSDHLLWEGDRCESLLDSVKEPLEESSYKWLQAQASLEKSNCGDLVGDLGTYLTAIEKGTREAEENGYTSLYLRGLGFEAQAAASFGDATTGFALASKGLSLFWSGQGDLMKGYNLYTDLDAASDDLRLSNLQVIISRQATYLIDRHPNVLLRAMAHRWYGNAAYLANMPRLAEVEYSNATALFARAPKTLATTRDRMDAEVWLAHIQIRQGDVEQAASRLQEVKLDLENTPSFNPEIGFYTAQADLGMKTSDSVATESALRSAIFLSEWALDSFPLEGDRRSWAEQTKSAYRNAVEWRLRAGDATAALELWEWYRGAELRAAEHASRHYASSLESTNPPDPRDAPPLPSPSVVSSQMAFFRDQTGVTYGIFPDGIAIWIFDDRGVYTRWTPTPFLAVQDLVTQFQRLCSDPASDPNALRKVARSLYDLLIAPVEDRLAPGRTMLIEPDGFLNQIPWEALVDQNGHYLIERAAVVISPGLYRAMNLRPTVAITAQSPALVVSVPTAPAEGLMPLTDAQIEAESVAARFGSARLLRGDDATLSAIRHEIRNAVILHFAGHAESSTLRTGLVLAELDPSTQRSRLITAGSFRLGETSHLQLAVLSACHTAAEPQIGASGTEYLVQYLLHANVPHVIASRWDVDSNQTARLMTYFYARLLSGGNAASSLRDAELTLASQPGSSHPYYWSAFELEGIK